MKLLIVTCLNELLADVKKIFNEAGIDVFSTTDIIGYRNGQTENILADWFASGDEQADSVMFFTFTTESKAARSIELIVKYNKSLKENFPARAFMLDVEKSI